MHSERLLIHVCCGPCLIAPLQEIRNEFSQPPTLYWYNPNIHPYREYCMRRDTLVEFAKAGGLSLIMDDDYDLEGFLSGALSEPTTRCDFCYRIRLEKLAETAAREGFGVISSTLLYSRYQNHEKIRYLAEEAARARGMAFYYSDFRRLWQQGIDLSKAAGMYRQAWCGCVFSERDRYKKTPANRGS